ncbi:hypothetical protein HGRIS_011383 [Hohenbuehelia grisea]|uniref:Uncharacterized protein n=1 Tax=Hohenbuehelia grisea TaxID=104357 RepID=A0ABR3JWA2_9AGAR
MPGLRSVIRDEAKGFTVAGGKPYVHPLLQRLLLGRPVSYMLSAFQDPGVDNWLLPVLHSVYALAQFSAFHRAYSSWRRPCWIARSTSKPTERLGALYSALYIFRCEFLPPF